MILLIQGLPIVSIVTVVAVVGYLRASLESPGHKAG